MKILIVYGTTEGHTRKIARFMEQVLQHSGHQVDLADASDTPPDPSGYDSVVIGASVHISKYQAAITDYISRYKTALNGMPGAFFSVSLAIASDIKEEHEQVRKITRDYLEQTGWKPVATIQVGGALKYTEYDYFKKLIMKMISKNEGRTTDTSKDHEFTDWPAVKQFVLDFAGRVPQPG